MIINDHVVNVVVSKHVCKMRIPKNGFSFVVRRLEAKKIDFFWFSITFNFLLMIEGIEGMDMDDQFNEADVSFSTVLRSILTIKSLTLLRKKLT